MTNQSCTFSYTIKLALYFINGAYKNILEANLLKCVQINGGLNEANKNKKIRKRKLWKLAKDMLKF